MLAISAVSAAICSIFIREQIRTKTKEKNRMSRASIGALIIEGARVSLGPREARPDLDSPQFVEDQS
jgi:hypothetical protein